MISQVLETTGKASGDGALRHHRLSGIFACCSDIIVDESQRAATAPAAPGSGLGGTPPSKWRTYNAADMATLTMLNVHEALRHAMAAAGAQAGGLFQAAMAEVDPHLASQIVQLGLGG